MNIYWLEQSDGDVPFGDQWLSGAERARLDGLRIPKRRADWRLGRWTAKCATSEYLDLSRDPESLSAVELRPAGSGAPEVFLHGRPAGIVLSLSHSHGIGFCAIGPANCEVGCDVEAVESHSAEFLADYFTDEERQLVAQAPPVQRDRVLTLLWSTKESVLKALGCGLRMDTRSVTAAPANPVHPHGGEWSRTCASHTSGRAYHGWWRESRGLVYTVVANPPPLRLVTLPDPDGGRGVFEPGKGLCPLPISTE